MNCHSYMFTHSYTGTHYKYSSDDIADLMSQASQLIEKALSISLPPPPPTLPPSSTWLSQLSDIWLIHALHKYSVQGKNVVCATHTVCLCVCDAHYVSVCVTHTVCLCVYVQSWNPDPYTMEGGPW